MCQAQARADRSTRAKRAKYPYPDITVTTTASSITHWSGWRPPYRSAVRSSARKIARYCVLAFAFPHHEAGTLTPSMAATPRRPETAISRPTITKAAQAQARSTATSPKRAPDTSSLSAIESRKAPRAVVCRQRRGGEPSRKAVGGAVHISAGAVAKAWWTGGGGGTGGRSAGNRERGR